METKTKNNMVSVSENNESKDKNTSTYLKGTFCVVTEWTIQLA